MLTDEVVGLSWLVLGDVWDGLKRFKKYREPTPMNWTAAVEY